jgi:hypothetical protein
MHPHAHTRTHAHALARRKEALATHLQEAADRGLLLQQELDAAQERAAAEAGRLRGRLKEAEQRLHEARRRLVAHQLGSKGLTLDQAQSLLQGDDVRAAAPPGARGRRGWARARARVPALGSASPG